MINRVSGTPTPPGMFPTLANYVFDTLKKQGIFDASAQVGSHNWQSAPLTALNGVGQATAAKLAKIGVKTVSDLALAGKTIPIAGIGVNAQKGLLAAQKAIVATAIAVGVALGSTPDEVRLKIAQMSGATVART